MTNSHFLQTTLGRIGLGLLMALFLFASSGWGAVAHAQVTGLDLGSDLGSDLKKAVGKGVVSVGEEAEEGSNEIVDDVASQAGGTGNPLIDGALQGAASALAGVASCAITAGIGVLVGGGLAALGLVVPSTDAAVTASTGASTLKECVLDGFISALKQGIIKGIIRGMITYVNNGFSGGPRYVTDEDAYFSNQRERLFKDYINNPNNYSAACSAWSGELKLSLSRQYVASTSGPRPTQLSGTGTGTTPPLSSSSQSCPLDNGGLARGNSDDYWGQFLVRTTRNEGNAISSYFNFEEVFVNTLEREVDKTVRELQRNEGFFDVTYCDDGGPEYQDIEKRAKAGKGDAYAPDETFQVEGTNCYVTTPGSVINAQLNSTLDSDLRQLEVADEIDDLVNALVGQLINALFNELGLLGTTKRTKTSTSVVEQYAEYESPAIVANSRDVLLGLMDNYLNDVEAFISTKNSTLNELFRVREVAVDVHQCYLGKYNTWVYNGTGTKVPDDQLDEVSEASRARATFLNPNLPPGALLRPETSLAKVDSHNTFFTEVNDDYIFQLLREIETAEFKREEVRLLRILLSQINNSDDPLSAALADSKVVALIAARFAEADTSNFTMYEVELEDGTLVKIPQEFNLKHILEVFAITFEAIEIFRLNDARNQQRLVEIAVEDLIEGKATNSINPNVPRRQGGFRADLALCKGFSQIYDPNPPQDDSNQR